MRRWARYFLSILCMLVLVGSSAISFAAASETPAASCPHEHVAHDEDTDQQPPKHHAAGCLSCCLGACAAIPTLPQRSSAGVAVFAAMAVSCWETGASLSGRVIPPDLGPPRTIL